MAAPQWGRGVTGGRFGARSFFAARDGADAGAVSPMYDRAMVDDLVLGFDRALRTLVGVSSTLRPIPGAQLHDATLTDDERRHAAGLMRVNHTGEVCAQALYAAQSLVARDPDVRARFAQAAREEEEHLAWTQSRLAELDARTSWLNPMWYAGSFAIGLAAGVAGDAVNLGFVVETERQVEEHLTGHMEELPAGDIRSRAIVDQMRDDEARHGAMAHAAGAVDLPLPVKGVMRVAASVMKSLAYRI
jgi:ubiquinone biosynthesis monooxygenase Coq7